MKLNILEGILWIFLTITFIAIIIPIFDINKKQELGNNGVKSSMKLLQKAVETYGQKNREYPSNLEELSINAKQERYDKTIFNPYTYLAGELERREISFTLTKDDYINIDKNIKFPQHKGKVAYYRINKHLYAIYGFDREGRYIEDNNTIFYLSNAR